MTPSRRWPRAAAALAAFSLGLVLCMGCKDSSFDLGKLFKKEEKPPEPKPMHNPRHDPIVADTVGDVSLLADAAPVRLRGFGLVVGLGDNGGTDCPTNVREYLLEYFTREFAPKGSGERREISPQRLLDSRDSAVVSVSGLVMAGSPTGAAFDVQVEALGSDTRSLEGGVLLPCELKLFDVNASGTGLIAGRTLAKARGPVFTSPVPSESAAASGIGPRRGVVLGGGHSNDDRGVKLRLEEPSYSTARKIERRVNERLGPNPRVAEAKSAGEVTLKTPPAFADRPDRMTELATHLLLDNGLGFVERRMRDLSESLANPGGKLRDIALIWEGVGKSVVPQIQPLYAHADPEVAYYAARTGLRLRDASAVAVIGQIAADASSPHHIEAVQELGTCGMQQAIARLVPLIDVEDPDTRIAAYQALLNTRHPAIQTLVIPAALDRSQVGLILDIVATRGAPLIYARRTREPRIAIFGAKMPVNLPVFYSHPDDWVTLNATDERGDITLFCRTRQSHKLSDRILVPPRVDELVRAMATPPVPDEKRVFRGIGLHYSLIVQVLGELCRNGTISANLVLEPMPTGDLLGPAAPRDRPESEDKPDPAPPATDKEKDKGKDKDGKNTANRARDTAAPAKKDRAE